jgi:hypothetical protein
MKQRLVLPGVVLATALLIAAVPAAAATALALAPQSYATSRGSDSGQPAAVLAVMDQAGAEDDPSRYVEFRTPGGERYKGTRTYLLPGAVNPAALTALRIEANYYGPAASTQRWVWKVYDWTQRRWVKLGDNSAAAAWQWSLLSFDAPGQPDRYINPVDGAIRVKLVSKDGSKNARLDYEAVMLVGSDPPGGIWQPPPGTSWQWQLSGAIDTSVDVQMYDIDLFETPQSVIDELHADGRVVICYFSAGSYEDFRPDAALFPAEVKGKSNGWPGEKWLDIRAVDVLAPIMEARLDLAVQKACDGVEPDNVDGYANNTGFPLTYQDQQAYNIWLANEAHARGLSVGLKNDLDQIADLLPHFDWALNEECFFYDECDLLLPFVGAGKAVFGVEYEGDPADFCPQANAMNFDWLKKNWDLDAWRIACR